MNENDIPFSINFGCGNLSKDINLDFQYEHTIINDENGGFYCEVYRFEELIKLNSVFEYSNANLFNIKTSDNFKDYSRVFKYYPPLVYDIMDIDVNSNRTKNCLTIHSPSLRRNNIHEKIDMDYFQTVSGGLLYCKNIMKNVMDDYKILVNIHQTDKYCTLEELRVLPALMTGILVISEESPYKSNIPYNQHIIWTKYEDLVETINDVLTEYEFFREKHLKNLSLTLNQMKKNSEQELFSIFKNFVK